MILFNVKNLISGLNFCNKTMFKFDDGDEETKGTEETKEAE